MADLDTASMHRLRAVAGWLELGLQKDALEELRQLPEQVLGRPDVLELRWMIEARLEQWAEALKTAEKIMALQPEEAGGWLHRAYALRRAPHGGLEQARAALWPAAEKFPKEATIPYNLSCYACQLGDLDEARQWLAEAIRRGGLQQIRDMALKDPDLAALHKEIKGAV
jgi:Flp pilus assembly protein TadD